MAFVDFSIRTRLSASSTNVRIHKGAESWDGTSPPFTKDVKMSSIEQWKKKEI